MVQIRKGVRFLTSGSFRKAKLREAIWPLFRSIYSNIEYIGISAQNGDAILAHSGDRFITMELLKFGRTDAKLPKVLRLLDMIGRPTGGWFVEVGANIGTETVSALRSGRFDRALAIEPEVKNRRLLEANLIMNGLADRACVRQIAVSNRRGEMVMALSATNKGDHRVFDGCAVPQGHHVGQHVEVATLGEIVANCGIAPSAVSLVWVDAQGHDGFILDGASPLIECGAPFVMEFWPSEMRRAGCYDLALEIIKTRFAAYYDLSSPNWENPQAPQGVGELAVSLQSEAIDLLLVPSP